MKKIDMIHYKAELEKINVARTEKSLIEIHQMFDVLEQRLIDAQQFEDVCHLYYNKVVFNYSYGSVIQALNVLMENRAFFDQYANYRDLVSIRLGTVVILESLGYTKNYYETMVEIKELAELHGIENSLRDSLNNIGYYFETIHDYEQAEHYYKRCIEKCEQDDVAYNNQTYLQAIINLANLYLTLQRYEDMQYYLDKYKAITYIKDPTFELAYKQIQFNYARNTDQALAKLYAEQLSQEPLEQMETKIVLNIYEDLVDYYEELDETEQAVEYMERLLVYMDKLSNHSMQQQSIVCQYGLEQAQLLEDLKLDSLTGVYNRKGFTQYVESKLTATNTFWKLIAILDIDYFKTINDTHGHLIGDEVLKEVSKRAVQFRQQVKELQAFAFGRYGGDEFYVYLQATSLQELETYVQQFYESLIKEPFHYDNEEFPISISFGGICSNQPQTDFMYWLNEADRLLYEVKQNERGQLKIASFQLQ